MSDVSNWPFDAYQTDYSISFVELMRHTNDREITSKMCSFVSDLVEWVLHVSLRTTVDNRLRMFKSEEEREREEDTAKHSSDNQCLPRILFVHSFVFPCPVAPCLCLSPIRTFACLCLSIWLRHCLSIAMCLWCVLTWICLFVLPFYVVCMYTVFIAINL